MSDIFEKLRGFWGDVSNRDIIEAADEIERLRALSKEIAEHPGPHADEAAFWRSERARATLAKG